MSALIHTMIGKHHLKLDMLGEFFEQSVTKMLDHYTLIFDETADRYDIRFDVNDYYGGLHCGDCMEVFVRGKWKPTRMEYGDNWYLVGIRAEDLNGLLVRI